MVSKFTGLVNKKLSYKIEKLQNRATFHLRPCVFFFCLPDPHSIVRLPTIVRRATPTVKYQVCVRLVSKTAIAFSKLSFQTEVLILDKPRWFTALGLTPKPMDEGAMALNNYSHVILARLPEKTGRKG